MLCIFGSDCSTCWGFQCYFPRNHRTNLSVGDYIGVACFATELPKTLVSFWNPKLATNVIGRSHCSNCLIYFVTLSEIVANFISVHRFTVLVLLLQHIILMIFRLFVGINKICALHQQASSWTQSQISHLTYLLVGILSSCSFSCDDWWLFFDLQLKDLWWCCGLWP